MRKVTVIGGGASGMAAAISAAYEGAEVTIVEHKDRIGKKLLSTGNGRCNFTNLLQKPEFYRSENPSFPWEIIQKFDAEQTVEFFERLGVYAKNRNGYLYPNSDQAAAVLEVLCMELKRLCVHILTNTDCTGILPKKRGFQIQTTAGRLYADAVILACGSKAAPVTGSDGSGYTLAKTLGHRMIPVLPALVQLRCKEKFYKNIAGVRAQGRVAVYADGVFLAEDTGEIQLVNYGISGIPVFQVSRYAAKALYEKKKVTAVLNFMPEMEPEKFREFLEERRKQRPEKTVEEFLVGLFHKKLMDMWIRLAGLKPQMPVGKLSEKEMAGLCKVITHFETEITAANSFEQAQICCGGIDTEDVCPQTLESLLVPGLYFTGEILDVDGICGGYNLQWAWSSGMIAGKEAAHA